MRNTILSFRNKLLKWLRSLLVTEGPLSKPELIERVDGYVAEVSEWKIYKKAKEATVRLSDGAMVSVFIPPPVVVHSGDYINISVYAAGDSGIFYSYRKHLTRPITQIRR